LPPTVNGDPEIKVTMSCLPGQDAMTLLVAAVFRT
jgi:hypothetical protein